MLEDTLNAIDQYVTLGKIAEAKQAFSTLFNDKGQPLAKMDEPVHRARTASLARRLHQPAIGVRLLNPLVRKNHSKRSESVSDSEKAEYAACLIALGSTEEGVNLLTEIDGSGLPQAWLFQAFAHFSRWEYQEAIHLLRKYLEHDEVDPYQRLVGGINLSAALIEQRQCDEAQAFLESMIQKIREGSYHLLLGNAFEHLSQISFLQKNFSEARKYLSLAEEQLGGGHGLDSFFVEKWNAVFDLVESPGKKRIDKLNRLKAKALDLHSWESVREIDRFICICTKDEELFLKLYFGTPYPRYREKLLSDFKPLLSVPEEFSYQLGEESDYTLDLLSGVTSTGAKLKRGNLEQRLLAVLASDFYRPARTATLFSRLFPAEFYNPESSPFRVHQAIKLFKAWLKKHEVPLRVESTANFYFLASEGIQLRVSQALTGEVTRDTSSVEFLRKTLNQASFTIRDVMGVLGVSKATALRLIKRASDDKDIEASGNARARKYKFK